MPKKCVNDKGYYSHMSVDANLTRSEDAEDDCKDEKDIENCKRDYDILILPRRTEGDEYWCFTRLDLKIAIKHFLSRHEPLSNPITFEAFNSEELKRINAFMGYDDTNELKNRRMRNRYHDDDDYDYDRDEYPGYRAEVARRDFQNSG